MWENRTKAQQRTNYGRHLNYEPPTKTCDEFYLEFKPNTNQINTN